MGTLVMVEFVTVDGVMQGLGSPDEDTDGGFTHGGWGLPYAAGIGQLMSSSGFAQTGAYLFGRRTYENMAAFWPHQDNSNPMAAHMNSTPKYVASDTLEHAAWQGTTILSGDVPGDVQDLKDIVDGDIAIMGSGVLCRSLLELDLVDELRLFIHPLLMGTGKRLFGDLPMPRALTLSSVQQSDQGSVALTYRVDRDG